MKKPTNIGVKVILIMFYLFTLFTTLSMVHLTINNIVDKVKWYDYIDVVLMGAISGYLCYTTIKATIDFRRNDDSL